MVIGIKGQLRDREINDLEARLEEAEREYAEAAQRGDADIAHYDAAVKSLTSQIRSLDEVRVS